MKFSSTLFLILFAFALTLLSVPAWSQATELDSIKDRIAIQEKLLYGYAYAWNSKDCIRWSNLFIADAIISEGGISTSGRDAIREACIARQKNALANIKTRHNMMNIVFDQLTARRAETRTHFIVTWQRPGEPIKVQWTGTYRDVIVKSDDGTWLFKERNVDLDQPLQR
jgi:SnoaL-like domain